MKKKVVLAFSGGLDTSYCVKYLSDEKGFEVHTITVNTGGFDEKEVREIEARAKNLGVASHKNSRRNKKLLRKSNPLSYLWKYPEEQYVSA